LLGILEKLSDPVLDVTENDQGQLEFRGKRKRFAITKEAEVFLPIDRVETPKHWEPIHPEFVSALERVQTCVSTDESKFTLTCIHVAPDRIEACDNHQLLRCCLETGVKESVLIRGTSVKEFVNLGVTHIAHTKTWMHFQNGEKLVLSCRRYVETYPELSSVIKLDGGYKVVFPKGIVEATDRAVVFASESSGSTLVRVTLKPGLLCLAGEGVIGWYEELKRVDYTGPLLDFYIDPKLLQHVAEEYTTARIADSKLCVRSKSKAWDYVTMVTPAKLVEKRKQEAMEALDDSKPKKGKKAEVEEEDDVAF
jgi:DNA polymerase III sliding clamp (beta) subunit (PCNA family)